MDTHGFAILNQLRTSFPHVQSMLMDRATLMAYQHAWSREPKQEKGVLRHLHEEETRLYDDLRFNVLGEQVRMEQERVAFDDVERTVKALVDASETIKS